MPGSDDAWEMGVRFGLHAGKEMPRRKPWGNPPTHMTTKALGEPSQSQTKALGEPSHSHWGAQLLALSLFTLAFVASAFIGLAFLHSDSVFLAYA